MQTLPVQLEGFPGCKRDGTRFDGNFLVNNQWNRWQAGRAKSMGGYSRITNLIPAIPRGLNTFDDNGYIYISTGSASALTQTVIDVNGNINTQANRTPAALVSSTNNLWQFDYIYDTSSSAVTVIAHAAQNLNDISNSTAGTVWYGNATGSAILTSTGQSVSGGVVCLQPYLFTFGSAGVINWSVPNKPADFSGTGSGTARIGAMKIVAALPIRGGAGNAPSGLFWALDSLIRASFVGGTPIFQFDTFTNEASILSSQSVIEYDGVYYWAGVDRFMSFNGTLREVPNDMNLDWFYNNLNFSQRQKVFALKVPRYGEIWWCYPRGAATECTHAVILNLRERRPDGMPVWYDTELPNNGRTCGHESQVFAYPILAGCEADDVTGEYKLWRHEVGTDQVDGLMVNAVEKFFETAEMTLIAPDQGHGQNKSIYVDLQEPDFYMTGSMTAQLIGRDNARAPDQLTDSQTFIAQTDGTGVAGDDQLVWYPTPGKTQRLARFRFTSNVQGGSYFAGKNIVHVGEADGRMRS